MYWLRKSLCCSADSHLKTVALSGMSASSQIARRLSPSAMRLQISSPSSVVNNDGRPAGRFRDFMGLYQVVKSPTLLPISQISRDLIQRRRGEFDMAAPISLRGDFDGPMLRALVL